MSSKGDNSSGLCCPCAAKWTEQSRSLVRFEPFRQTIRQRGAHPSAPSLASFVSRNICITELTSMSCSCSTKAAISSAGTCKINATQGQDDAYVQCSAAQQWLQASHPAHHTHFVIVHKMEDMSLPCLLETSTELARNNVCPRDKCIIPTPSRQINNRKTVISPCCAVPNQ